MKKFKTIFLATLSIAVVVIIILLSNGSLNKLGRKYVTVRNRTYEAQCTHVRAILDEGIELYNANPADTAAYKMLKEAEQLFDSYDFYSIRYSIVGCMRIERSIKEYLAYSCETLGNKSAAIKYYREAVELYSIFPEDMDVTLRLKHQMESLQQGLPQNEINSLRRINELEWQYEMSKKQAELVQSRHNTWMIAIITLSVIVVIVLLLFYYRNSARKNRQIAKLAEQESSKNAIVSKLLDQCSGLMPKFCNQIYEIVVRNDGISGKTTEEINLAIDNIKKEYKENLSTYFITDSIIRDNPIINSLSELSEREKTIVLLIEQGYDTRYMARILNTTQNGIRSSKRKALLKIKDSTTITTDDKQHLIALLEQRPQ